MIRYSWVYPPYFIPQGQGATTVEGGMTLSGSLVVVSGSHLDILGAVVLLSASEITVEPGAEVSISGQT